MWAIFLDKQICYFIPPTQYWFFCLQFSFVLTVLRTAVFPFVSLVSSTETQPSQLCIPQNQIKSVSFEEGRCCMHGLPDFLESAVPNQFLDSCMTVAARVWPEAGTRCTRTPFFIYADPAPNSVCDGYSSTRLQLIMCRQTYSRWWKEKISQGWSRVHSSVGHVDTLPVRGLSTTTSTE